MGRRIKKERKKYIYELSLENNPFVLQKSKELHTVSAQLKKHKIDIVKIIQILQGYFIFGTF